MSIIVSAAAQQVGDYSLLNVVTPTGRELKVPVRSVEGDPEYPHIIVAPFLGATVWNPIAELVLQFGLQHNFSVTCFGSSFFNGDKGRFGLFDFRQSAEEVAQAIKKLVTGPSILVPVSYSISAVTSFIQENPELVTAIMPIGPAPRVENLFHLSPLSPDAQAQYDKGQEVDFRFFYYPPSGIGPANGRMKINKDCVEEAQKIAVGNSDGPIPFPGMVRILYGSEDKIPHNDVAGLAERITSRDISIIKSPGMGHLCHDDLRGGLPKRSTKSFIGRQLHRLIEDLGLA